MKIEHEVMYDILVEFDRICKKHNIPYSLIDGTLLGAIRHEGFIPWDDDIDVGMLRQDYDRFIAVCADELKEGFFFQTHGTQPEYVQCYAKIRSDKMEFIQDLVADRNIHHGYWLDVFPFENVPEDKKLREQQVLDIDKYNTRIKYLNYIMFNPEDSFIKKAAKSPFVLYKKIFKRNDTLTRRLMKKRDQLIQKYNHQESTLVANLSEGASPSYGKFNFNKSIFNDFVQLKFENANFDCFADYEHFLTTTYGDYMTPPDEEDRVGH